MQKLCIDFKRNGNTLESRIMTAVAEGLTFESEPSGPLATLLPGLLDTIAGFADLDIAIQNRLRQGLSSSIDVVELTCAVQALGSAHNQ